MFKIWVSVLNIDFGWIGFAIKMNGRVTSCFILLSFMSRNFIESFVQHNLMIDL